MIIFTPASLFNSVIVTTLAISKVTATFALANIGTNGYYSHVAACGSSQLVCDCWTSASPSYVVNLSAFSISPGVCDSGQLAVVWQGGTSDEWYVYSDGNNVVATCSSWYAPSVECDKHIEVAPLLYCVSSKIQC